MRYKKLKIAILVFLGLILGVHVILLLSGWYRTPVLYCAYATGGAGRDRDDMEADNLVAGAAPPPALPIWQTATGGTAYPGTWP